MAITKCKQISAGRRGSGKSDYNRVYVVRWVVMVNSAHDGMCTIGQHPDLPLRFAPYVGYENTDDPAALCSDMQIEQDGDEWKKWHVTATFETRFNQDQHGHEDPTDRPLERWLEIEFENRTITEEWDGTPIRNSAGQLLAGLTRDDAVGIYCFERWERGINSRVKSWNNSTNDDRFYDLLKNEGLLRIHVAKPEYFNGEPFVKHTYRVRIKEGGWDIEPVDRGTAVLGVDGKQRAPTDVDGNPLAGDEVNLDGNGKLLLPGNNLVYLAKKKLFKPNPYAILNLEV